MPDPIPALLDAFHNLVFLGDEVATITYLENEPYRGIVVKFGKNRIKVIDNFYKTGEERWITARRSIRLRSKKEIELKQN